MSTLPHALVPCIRLAGILTFSYILIRALHESIALSQDPMMSMHLISCFSLSIAGICVSEALNKLMDTAQSCFTCVSYCMPKTLADYCMTRSMQLCSRS